MVTDAADSDTGIQVLFNNFTVLNVKISVLVVFQPSEVIGVMVGKAVQEKDSLLLSLISKSSYTDFLVWWLSPSHNNSNNPKLWYLRLIIN